MDSIGLECGDFIIGGQLPYKSKMPKGKRKFYRAGRSSYGRPKRSKGRSFQYGELKFHDLVISDAVIAIPGTITPSVNLIADGTTDQDRIGRKSVVRQLHWNFRIQLPGSAGSTATGDLVTVICFLDRQANGGAAFATDILETDFFMSFNNIENKERFRILFRKTYVLNARSGAGNGSPLSFGKYEIYDEFHKKCNIPIQFSGTSGVISEVKSNNIGVLLMSQQGLCGFNSQFRVRFTDS